MNKSILLVYPEPDFDKDPRFGYSLQLLYLSSSLKDQDFQVKFVDYSVEKFDEQNFHESIDNIDCVIVELDAFPLKRSANVSNGFKIAQLTKEHRDDILTVAIGKHCTLVNESIPGFDLTVSGEPEVELPRIINGFLLGGEIKNNFISIGTIADLSRVPFPDRQLLDKEQIKGKRLNKKAHLAPSALLETSRGCPGNCSFCQRKGWDKKLRFFSEEKIYTDFQELISSGINNIWVTDENFTANLGRAKRILNKFAELKGSHRLKIAISSWAKIDKEFISVAQKAGVSVISFGVESKNANNLKFYNKIIDFDLLDEILEEADRMGVFTIGNFIVGAPDDDEETIQESLNYAIHSRFDDVNVKLLDYMIGSELYEGLPDKMKDGKIHLFSCAENGLTGYSKHELLSMKNNFIAKFKDSKKTKLIEKIKEYGPPYYTEKFG
jgi:radical SAM superfamily enzyme YgiQ (UPF0313 family)